MSDDLLLSLLPESIPDAITLANDVGVVVYPAAKKPLAPTGTHGSPGIFNNRDGLGDAALMVVARKQLYGEDDPVARESIRNIARWLSAMDHHAWDPAHSQREPSLAYAYALEASPERDTFLHSGFLRWYATLTANPMLKTRTGMTTRPFYRFFGSALRGARILSRLQAAGVVKELPGGALPPAVLEEKVLAMLLGWANDRGEEGKSGEEGRGFTYPIEDPWRPGKPGWPYRGFGDDASIGQHEQAFMHDACLGHSILWADAYGVEFPREVKIRFREIATWALRSFFDPATDKFLEAQHKGDFRPDKVKLPFSSWPEVERAVEGSTEHGHGGTFAVSRGAATSRRFLLEKALGTRGGTPPKWLRVGEFESQTLLSLYRLRNADPATSTELFGEEEDAT
jgi:hypothetical protein